MGKEDSMIEVTAEQITASVAAGAEWLDEQCPAWPTQVDIDLLDMGNAYSCTLGQTADCIVPTRYTEPRFRGSSGWYVVLSHIGTYGTNWAVEHGFDAPLQSDITIAYEMQRIAWIAEIRKRLDAHAQP
jgi:hypothetical protein